MQIETAINTLNETIFVGYLAASVRGTAVAVSVGHTDLPDVTSNSYTNVLLAQYTLEDIGVLEVSGIYVNIRNQVLGSGSIRWQVSGDGGNNWTTFIEVQNFNVGVFANLLRIGTGTWITSIDPGSNKLQIRCQVLANSGTVSSKIYDLSVFWVQYRQKIRP